MRTRRIAFKNARLIDPASGLDVKGGLLVEGGKIVDVGPRLFNDAEPDDPEVVDCKGLVLAPGLIDMRVFTGEPGSEHRETLESASAAAAAGGVTTIVVMPNTDPIIDEPSLVDFLRRRADATARVRVAPMAALTRQLAGERMTEIGLLKEAGAVAFTDGDRTIASARVLRRALAYASTFGALVVGHAEDPELSEGASMTEGEYAMRLGIPAAPAAAEAIVVERDIRLVELTGVRYHFSQISCAASLEIISGAKARGLPVSCGVSAHHLALNELDVGAYYTFMKVKPPLRCEADRQAMVDGIASGVIDVIVSSHDPQAADTKRQPFAQAAFGAVGLETLLPVALSLYHDRRAGLPHILKALTATPRAILGLPTGTLARGAPADIVLIDVEEPFVVEPEDLHSRARNTPFAGRRFQGRAQKTFVGGELVFDREKGETLMVPWQSAVLSLPLGYVLGSIPFGLVFAWLAGAGDVRKVGSGNIGATNVLRTGKRWAAAATLLFDAGKGAAAVLIARRSFGDDASLVAAFGAFLGHIFPIWLGFKGGKGVATFLGILFALNWLGGVMVACTWLGAAAIWRISSLSALIAAALAPLYLFMLHERSYALFALVLAVMIFAMHRENIRRLLQGQEPRIGARNATS